MLYYSLEGNFKETIVLLHGFLENSSMWDFINPIDLNMRLLKIDLPGHGKSKLIKTCSPSLHYIAKQVLAALDREKIEKVHLVGHSMGGYIGLVIQQLRPSLIDKFIFLNSHFWEDDELKKRDRLRLSKIIHQVKPIFLSEAIPNLFHEPQRFTNEINKMKKEANEMSSEAIAYSSIAMTLRDDFSLRIKTNPEAYYFILGDSDTLIDPKRVKKYANRTAVFILTNSGHMSHIESPENVKKILQDII